MSLRLAQLHLYVDIHRHDLYVAPVLAIVVAGLISAWVPLAWAATWLVLELAIIANYLSVYRRFKLANPPARDERAWANRIARAHGAHMLAWSSLVIWAWQVGNFSSLIFVMLVHVGLISLTVSMSNAHLRLLCLDMIFPVAALVGPPLLEPGWMNIGLTLLGGGFSVLMMLVGRQINTYTTEAIELRQRNEILIKELESQASRDSLTGIINRRYLLDTAKQLLQRAGGPGAPLALLIIDLDHFKDINDRYGHLGGDEVLVAVVDACVEHLRSGDCLGRLGGEEFALLLPDTAQDAAREAAERLRQAVEALSIPLQQDIVRPTVSIGIALAERENTPLSELMHRADLAMYAAKMQGRNRVVCAEGQATTGQFASTPAANPI
jgi:diguanylate cyclase (GGDEF)-like protein